MTSKTRKSNIKVLKCSVRNSIVKSMMYNTRFKPNVFSHFQKWPIFGCLGPLDYYLTTIFGLYGHFCPDYLKISEIIYFKTCQMLLLAMGVQVNMQKYCLLILPTTNSYTLVFDQCWRGRGNRSSLHSTKNSKIHFNFSFNGMSTDPSLGHERPELLLWY